MFVIEGIAPPPAQRMAVLAEAVETVEVETAVTIAVAKEEIAATTEAANTAAEIDKNEGKIFLQAIGFARVVRITISPRVMFVIEGIAPPPAQRMAVLAEAVETVEVETAVTIAVATEEAVTSETTVVATAGHNTAEAVETVEVETAVTIAVATEEAVTSETTVVATAGHNTAAAGMAEDAVVTTVDLNAPAAIADHRSEAIVQTLTENLPASIGSLAM
jgi:hypothetical protein